ncbi:hypothetical protein D3C85_1039450 [compost metagenome]
MPSVRIAQRLRRVPDEPIRNGSFRHLTIAPLRLKLGLELALVRLVIVAHLGQDQLIQHGAVGVHHPTAGAQTRLAVRFKPVQQQRDHLFTDHTLLIQPVRGELPGKVAGLERIPDQLGIDIRRGVASEMPFNQCPQHRAVRLAQRFVRCDQCGIAHTLFQAGDPSGTPGKIAGWRLLLPGIGPSGTPDAFMLLFSAFPYHAKCTGSGFTTHGLPCCVLLLPKMLFRVGENEEAGKQRHLQGHPCGDPARPAPALAHGPVLRERCDDDERQKYRAGHQEHDQRRPTRSPVEESCSLAGRSSQADEENDHYQGDDEPADDGRPIAKDPGQQG